MDEEFMRGLRSFCEQPGIVCARQAQLHLPGTVCSVTEKKETLALFVNLV